MDTILVCIAGPDTEERLHAPWVVGNQRRLWEYAGRLQAHADTLAAYSPLETQIPSTFSGHYATGEVLLVRVSRTLIVAMVACDRTRPNKAGQVFLQFKHGIEKLIDLLDAGICYDREFQLYIVQDPRISKGHMAGLVRALRPYKASFGEFSFMQKKEKVS